MGQKETHAQRLVSSCARDTGGGGGGGGAEGLDPPGNHKAISFLSNTGLDHWKIKKLFNVRPMAASEMLFEWRFESQIADRC